MSINDQKKQQMKLIEIIRQTIETDEALRKKYDINNKFRFVRDRLHALMSSVEKEFNIKEEEKAASELTVGENELIVYVYLFNAHGAKIQTWQNMLRPKIFYEYSVNRPIYLDKKQIDALIYSKMNKTQHGYIEVIINKDDIIKPMLGGGSLKDSYGNEIIKIKEGSLHFEKLISFTHNEITYSVNEKGELSVNS